jgi:hypothetical protein
MMANVREAVKDADVLLAIVDSTYKAEEALAMVQVRRLLSTCVCAVEESENGAPLAFCA